MRLFLFFVFLSFFSCKYYSTIPGEISELIETVQKKYAPDRRVARFQVESQLENRVIVLRGETNLPEAKDSLLSRIKKLGISFRDRILLLPDKSLNGKEFGVVRVSVGNIRTEPKHSAELTTQATLGTILRVLKKEGDWFLVQTPDDYIAWLDRGGFILMNKKELETWKSRDKFVYLPELGFALSEPNTNSEVVSDLLAGNILLDLEKEGSFAKIAFPDGRTAYVPHNEVMPYEEWKMSRNPNVGNIIATAKKFMGRPYLWGGTSGKGIDCSGFTKSVFFLNGVLIARDASQQVHTGVLVDTDSTLVNLESGDFLFFGRKATPEKKERISHVGIYLGDGKMIHSGADNGGVKIESLRRGDPDFAEHRLNTFIRAKRMLTSLGENGIGLLAESPYY